MKNRHGCLTLLVLWGLLGLILQIKYDIGAGQGGAMFFFAGLLGLVLFGVIALIDLILWFNSRRGNTLHGFEVLPPKEPGEKE